MSKPDTNTGLEIAVIGMSGRFPDSKNIDALWDNLKRGKEMIRYFSDEELLENGISAELVNNPHYVKAKGVLDDIEYFDAPFFGYTNKEADYMDPQLRIFHECAYNALENAGYASDKYKGVTGLFAGAGFNPFWMANFLPSFKNFSEIIEISSLNARDYLTTRVAYKLNLSGPSITLQTACSTSLVAIHLASQSLLAGECDMALAGGVSVLFPAMNLPRKYGMLYQEGMIISPDGHCRPFDKDASGFMGGDGVGIVVLKRLDDAIKQGDNILAIIKGSAINNDGGSKAGYAAPSIEGQRRVIQTALAISGVNPQSIVYIETHGSGTQLGDPIEVEGLRNAYKTQKTQFCGLGSIKSNVGHLDAAAGVAGFIKTVLALKHKQIPPSINYNQANPKIDFENSPFYVNATLKEWHVGAEPRRAAVSSFGIGGTNAHLILEEAPVFESSNKETIESLVVLSAQTENVLDNICKNLKRFLVENKQELNLRDVAYTLQVGRNSFEFKRSVVCSDIDELIVHLSDEDNNKKYIRHKGNNSNSVVFIFSGLGAQYVNMGLGLYLSDQIFRKHMDECFHQLFKLVDLDLKSILYPSISGNLNHAGAYSRDINNFEIAQLSVFVFEFSISKLLIELGVQPTAVMGYSFGEYTAACISGIISLNDALKIILRRGQLIVACEKGALLSVPLERKELTDYLSQGLELAIDNGESCVLSGPVESITAFEDRMKKERILCMRLQAQHAVHSSMMMPSFSAFEKTLTEIEFNINRIPYVSNVTGTWVSQQIQEPAYWIKHLSQTVEFSKGIETILKLPNTILIEIGPGADITSMLQKFIENNSQHLAINTIRPEASKTSDTKYILSRLQKFWQRGLDIHWHKLYEGEKPRRIALPEYPFEKYKFWFRDSIEAKDIKPLNESLRTDNDLVKNENVSEWFYLPSWEQESVVVPEEEFNSISNWLVFSDNSELSSGIISELRKSDQNVIVVEQGKAFEKTGSTSYVLNPTVENQYNYLIRDLLPRNFIVEKVIHLWNKNVVEINDLKENGIDQCLANGFYSLTGLAKALHENEKSNQEVKFFIITSGIYSITANEKLAPIHASILGALKVLPIEFQNIKSFHVDIDENSVSRVEDVVGQVIKELITERSNLAIAWRGKNRWILNYKKLRLENNQAGLLNIIKHNKIYLIVGGLCTRSNLGFIFSNYLSRTVKAKIILLSRTVYPDRSEWHNILSDNQNSELKEKIAQIKVIEKGGGQVFTVSSDITKIEHFQKSIDEIEKRIGNIDGVINVAGVMDGKSMDLIINSIPRKDFKSQFEVKIKGTINVYNTFINRKIDFCVFSSSLTSVLGPFAAYTAANNFIDALVNKINQLTNSCWVSVNWDHLLGFNDKQHDQPLAINHDEIIECFERIISARSLSQVVVSSGDIQKRIAKTFRTAISSGETIFDVKNILSKWFYKPDWENISKDIDIDNGRFAGCIVFVKDLRFNINLLKHLRSLSEAIITVRIGDSYIKNGNEYQINPSNSQHYTDLFEEIKRDRFEVRSILHLWNSDEANPLFVNLEKLNLSQNEGFYSLLNIVRSLNYSINQNEIAITILTSNMQSVIGDETLCPEKATLLGAVKVVPFENSNLKCISIDIDADEVDKYSEAEMHDLTTNIINDASGKVENFSLLSYRKSQRYVQKYVPVKLKKKHTVTPLRENGVYLITGGLGGMSMELIGYLAQHYQAKFIIVDRKDFPVRKDWDCLLKSNETPDDIKSNILKIENAEKYGSEFILVNADICDYQKMTAVMNDALASFGAINGVFHIAGLIDLAGIIQTRSMQETADVLAPKVTGTLVLDELLKGQTLDFVLYFSSTGNIFPRLKFGQVAYNAGHEFIDAFAQAKRRKGENAFAINWNDWKNTGIAAQAARNHNFKIKDQNISFEKILSVKPQEGIISLIDILESDQSQVIISAFDVNSVLNFINNINLSEISGLADDKEKPDKSVRPELSSTYLAPVNKIEADLVEIFKAIFRIEKIGVDDDFFELGGDSIKAISAISHMQQKHGFDLPITIFFETRTARNMCAYLNKDKVINNAHIDEIAEKAEDDGFNEPFPISAIQMAYLMGRSEHFDMGGISTNVYQESEILVDLKLLNDSFNVVLNRHPMLKIIVLPNGTQQFHRVSNYKIKNKDLRKYTNEEQLRFIQEERIKLSNYIFDATQWPLFEISTLQLTDEKSYIFFCFDHLICDAASIMIFVKDWGSLLEDPTKLLPKLNYTYRNYILDFQKLKASEQFERSKRYWIGKLDEFPSAPALPFKCAPTDITKPKFKRQRKFFSKQEWDELRKIARKNNCTPSVILCSAYARVLSFWSNSNELAINLTLFNRYPFHEHVEKIVGDFTMLVLLGLNLKPHDDILEDAKIVQRTLLEALDNRFYDGVDFIRELRKQRQLGTSAVMPFVFTSALFDSELTANETDGVLGFWGQQRDSGMAVSQTSQVYIDCTAAELHGGLELVWDYVEDLFDEEVINSMFAQFTLILNGVLTGNSRVVLEAPQSHTQLADRINATNTTFPDTKTIKYFFEFQVSKTPNNVALFDGNEKIRFSELNERANKLARILRERGITSESIVAIIAERSFEMMIGIYAIVKSGGAYLPLTPNIPDLRIDYILEDAKVKLVLSQKKFIHKLSDNVVTLILEDEKNYHTNGQDLEPISYPENLAYVIYTSGSTGNPKGVMIEHRSLVNRLNWMQNKYPLTKNDKLIQKTPIGFDVSVWELFWWTFQGASLALLPPDNEKSPELLTDFIESNGITTIHFVPSMFGLFLNYLEETGSVEKIRSLKWIFNSGEALLPSHVKKFNYLFKDHSDCQLINLYGPTEATIDVSYYNCTGLLNPDIIPIGKPIDNTKLYVLDELFRPLPLGVPGQLFISGVGVARGYINQEKLTKEKFLKDRFNPDQKMYATGDQAILLPDGEILYIGRIDTQIKIRGNRIETSEIENCLTNIEKISAAIVSDKSDEKGNKYLCAYLVAEEGISVSDLRKKLSLWLPDYMIPTHFVYMEEIPFTTNGKINRVLLPDPGKKIHVGTTYQPATTQLHHQLVGIFGKLLNIEKVGIDDSFFDLGGDSFKATFLLTEIQKESTVKLSLAQVFKTPCVRGLAEIIEISGSGEVVSIEHAHTQEYYPLSSQQMRMYILNRVSPDATNYNISTVKLIEGIVEVEKFKAAFRLLIAKHEILRTSFHNIDGEPRQKIHDHVNFEIEYFDSNGEDANTIIHNIIKPFELGEAPLFRVGLIRIEANKHLLVLDMHHIIIDLPSLALLINDFLSAYQDQPSGKLKFQYKDYAAWQHSDQHRVNLGQQKAYWLDQFKDEIPLLDLRTDFIRQPQSSLLNGDRLQFDFECDTVKTLKHFAKQNDVTMHMLLMSAFLVFLSKLSGQEDIVVGSPVIDTRPPELSETVGMFVNTIALRGLPTHDKAFIDFLDEIKDRTLANYQHLDYQFEDLVNALEVKRDLSRNPLFDVMLDVQNESIQDISIPGLKIKDHNIARRNSNFDFAFIFFEGSDSLHLNIDYRADLFSNQTISNFYAYYLAVVKAVIVNSEQKIGEMEIISEEERTRLMKEFNNTSACYPGSKTITELFEEQVKRTPDNIAVRYEGENLTYQELNEQSEKLATYLIMEKSVKTGDLIGIMLEREALLIPSLFAILKAGAAYIPIDPTLPEERVDSIIRDSKINLLITREKYLNPSIKASIINLDVLDLHTLQSGIMNSRVAPGGRDLAYVIYTSGSTGNPKGVMVEHHSVINRILWMQKEFSLTENDVILQKTSTAFDVSVWELFWWSFTGASLCLLKPKGEKDPKEIINAIEKNKVTTIHFVPSMLNTFLLTIGKGFNYERVSSLRQVFSSGEALKVTHVDLFGNSIHQHCGTSLINLYGPTEATVDVSYYKCTFEQGRSTVPIGKPIDNTSLYVLDKNMRLVPIGALGELYIGGAGLARGYLNNEKLTNEKFVKNPHVDQGRIYRTGDQARWLPEGNIEFLGRIDNQVKIRGFRIELEEIEHMLAAYDQIKETVIIANERSGDKYLVAHYTSDKVIEASHLRKYLANKLPDYMIPAYYVQVPALPLTANGKLDRKALPAPIHEVAHHFKAPANETEHILVEIWSEILGLEKEKISLNQSFFILGGNSLKLIQLNSAINGKLNWDISIAEMFSYTTIASLIEFIGSGKNDTDAESKKLKEEIFEMQSAIYLFDKN